MVFALSVGTVVSTEFLDTVSQRAGLFTVDMDDQRGMLRTTGINHKRDCFELVRLPVRCKFIVDLGNEIIERVD
jgi:hypothetical protein